jgi:hypothetical protein
MPDNSAIDALVQSTETIQFYAAHGMFMIAWAGFENSIDLIIKRETGMSSIRSLIVVSGLGFERKASIARSLLALRDDKPSIAQINKIVQFAARNMLMHGSPEPSRDKIIFHKAETDQCLKVKERVLTREEALKRLNELIAMINELDRLTGITQEMARRYREMVRNLASK